MHACLLVMLDAGQGLLAMEIQSPAANKTPPPIWPSGRLGVRHLTSFFFSKLCRKTEGCMGAGIHTTGRHTHICTRTHMSTFEPTGGGRSAAQA